MPIEYFKASDINTNWVDTNTGLFHHEYVHWELYTLEPTMSSVTLDPNHKLKWTESTGKYTFEYHDEFNERKY